MQRAIKAVRKLAMKVESSARMKRAVAMAIKSMGLPDPEAAVDKQPSPTGQWRTFPPDMGSLGIPRAEMPQIRASIGEHSSSS